MEQMYAGVKTLIDSTETVLKYELKQKLGGAIFPGYVGKDGDVTWLKNGDEKWWIGNHDSAARLYGAIFSPLEEKFTGLSCDPDSGYDDLSEADLEKMREKAGREVYEKTGRTPDEVFEILERESKKPWWQFWADGVKYHIEDKDTLVRGIKTGSLDSEQWI
jgi:hypothetical protein